MAEGNERVPGSGNSVTWPSVVIRPMRSAAVSVNHSAPSGPAAMPNGPQSGDRWNIIVGMSGRAPQAPGVDEHCTKGDL